MDNGVDWSKRTEYVDDEHPNGEWWGANAWLSNQSDRRTYAEVDDE
ncbi:hypothetical protein [Prauserella aidingensis]|nr:hypothetical protein [Prauserella aidingensis]